VLPGYDVTTWYGVFGPPGLPAAVVATLNKTLIGILADDKIKQRLVTVGVVVKASSASEFGTFMQDETKKWDAVRKAAGIAQQ
jgi:tripartite-type tricarboxylate transporter receptor subunit TctC